VEQESEIVVPPQPIGEQGKLRLMSVSAIALCFVVALANTPYDLTKQSTIMVKCETAKYIWAARDTHSYWPKDQFDPGFGFGRLGSREDPRMTFTFEGIRPDKSSPAIENASYDFVLRGEHSNVIVSYDSKTRKQK
jgi:hypothetical protein